jgi:dihydrofolate reductase
MRELVLKMSMSVDGFVGGPGGEVDWIFRSTDDGGTRWVMNTLASAGVHIMGSRTFRDMAAFWPTSTQPFAAPMNDIPKVVFTKKGSIHEGGTTGALDSARRAQSDEPSSVSTDRSSWLNPIVASGDLVDEITRLKEQDGAMILAHGGASFAQSLVAADLVDEYRLLVHPVVLGRGLPLFSAVPQPRDLKLMRMTAFAAGTIAKVYRRA